MQSAATEQSSPMRNLRVGKVVLNVGVGRSGEAVERAKKVIEELADQTPCTTRAKTTIRDFGTHKGEPIGVVLTLRGEKAVSILKRLLETKGMKLPDRSFDEHGSISFGIKEHIEIRGTKYRPELGIFGLDVSVVLERPGFRVARRRRSRSRVGTSHRVTKGEAINFFGESLGVEVA